MSIIENGLRADIFRKRIEDKNTLKNANDIYVGTGNKETINGVDVYTTESKNLIDAINEAQTTGKKIETAIKSAELNGTTLTLTI